MCVCVGGGGGGGCVGGGGGGVWGVVYRYESYHVCACAHVYVTMCHCVYVCFTVCHVMRAYLSCLELLQDGCHKQSIIIGSEYLNLMVMATEFKTTMSSVQTSGRHQSKNAQLHNINSKTKSLKVK